MKTSDAFTAGENDAGKRLDRVLRKCLPDLPLSAVFRLLRRGLVRVNGLKAVADRRLAPGDRIEVKTPLSGMERRSASPADSPALPLSLVLFRNEHVLAVNKPYGALAHGPGSLEARVRSLVAEALPASLSFQPGPAHRLDRNTTGLQLYSLSVTGARLLLDHFRLRQVVKIYCALVRGRCEREAEWIDFLIRDRATRVTRRAEGAETGSARRAVTLVRPLFTAEGESLVLLAPHSGLTHQLRSQSALHGHPLAGDIKYGGGRNEPRYLLHHLYFEIPPGPLSLPPLLAPFDESETAAITSRFGRRAPAAAREQALAWAETLKA